MENTLKDRKVEVELGFDARTGYKEAERCLNCDVQTVFDELRCIECDACVDICPTDCISFIVNDEEPDAAQTLRRRRAIWPRTSTFPPSCRPAGHGQGRGRVPALRPVRGALPDQRLGYAEVSLQCTKAGQA